MVELNNKSQLYTLLKKYASGSITKVEFEELQLLITSVDDYIVNNLLEQLWNENICKSETVDKAELKDVLISIEKKVRKEKRALILKYTIHIAAIIILPLLLTVTAYMYKDLKEMQFLGTKDVVVAIERGQNGRILLPDSSIVYLNAESSLSYKQNFGYQERSVRLRGEAFFEVNKDSLRKFHVFTDHLKIEVTGTSFNVYAHEDESFVEMVLVSGSVFVETLEKPIQCVKVNPNEKILFDKTTNQLIVQATDTHFETAWLRGELAFRSEPIKNVFAKIERKYGVQLDVNGDWDEEDRFTGCFENYDIEQVMEILKAHYKITYKIKGEHVIIYTVQK